MKKVLLAVLLAAMVAAACSSDASETPDNGADETASGATFPVEVAGATIESQPERIVSLSTVSTEVLFAIGAGDQVIAVDSQSNYPTDAPVTELSSFEPNVEAIAEFEPDLVFTSFDPGDLVSGLDTLGIPVIVHPTAISIDDAYGQIEQVGVATGRVGEAAALVASMQSDFDSLIAAVPDVDEAPTYFHELDNTFFSTTSATFIGEIYGLAGMVNIADPADPDGFGYPQLSEEYILDENPDFVFLADTLYGESIETVAARPGWGELDAVQQDRVVELDSDTASRWGPRMVDFYADVVGALEAAYVG